MWQVNDDKLVRFRCHTGHAFYGETLLEEQVEALAAALWTAVRIFKERMVRRNSVRKWQQNARELHGLPDATWRLASDRNIACEHYKQPALNGRVSCVASGRPCARGQ